jgi:hypothetical protein
MGEAGNSGQQAQSTDLENCRFEFHKRAQLFISVRNEPFSVIAVCIGNPYYSPLASHC